MKNGKNIMMLVTWCYLVVVGAGLFLAARYIRAETLLDIILPLALALLVLWFVLIYAALRKNLTKGISGF